MFKRAIPLVKIAALFLKLDALFLTFSAVFLESSRVFLKMAALLLPLVALLLRLTALLLPRDRRPVSPARYFLPRARRRVSEVPRDPRAARPRSLQHRMSRVEESWVSRWVSRFESSDVAGVTMPIISIRRPSPCLWQAGIVVVGRWGICRSLRNAIVCSSGSAWKRGQSSGGDILVHAHPPEPSWGWQEWKRRTATSSRCRASVFLGVSHISHRVLECRRCYTVGPMHHFQISHGRLRRPSVLTKLPKLGFESF